MTVFARTRRVSKSSAQDTAARVQAKRGVIEQLIAGRISLLAAAVRFGALCGSGDTTAYCRTVIGWAGLALSDRPERAADVVGRLEAELERYLARASAVPAYQV
jgi:hypothetical protein